MKREELIQFLNKKVYLKRKSGFHYTAVIKKINEESMIFIDKFQSEVLILLDDIEEISEWREEGMRQ